MRYNLLEKEIFILKRIMYKHLIFLNNLVIDYDLNQVLQVQSNISERNIILKNKENKDFPTNDGSIRSIKL